jgi:endoglucanase
MADAFARLWRLFVSRGIPVVVTEFGAVDKSNEVARAAWAAAVMRLGRTYRIPCLWWDTALLEKGSHTWRYPALLRALVR